MAQRQVTVTINGEETVSKAAKEAEQGLTGFAGFMQQFKDKLIPVIDVTKLVEFAVRALTTAFNVAKQFVMDSIGAYDAYITAQTKLAAQSKLTGVSMREMNALVDTAREKFGLSTVAAVDITAAVAKFASQSGDATKASQLMASALELGAAAGMNAAQVAEGLSSALAGNDEWLNRLGLANPSQLWKDYADANALVVSKMSETEKKLAVLTAIMDAGNKVTGVYAERLASGAGEQERLTNKVDEAQASFGAAIQPIRIFVVQGLTALVKVIGPVVVALGYLASGVLNMVVGPLKLAYSAVGSVIEVVGKLSGNKSLEQWGKNASQEFARFTDDIAKWLGVAKPATQVTTEMGKAHELAAVKIVASKDATDKHAESTKRAKVEHEALKVVLGMTQGAMERLSEAARDQLPPRNAQDFSAAMDNVRRNADALMAKFPPITQSTDEAAGNTRDMAREVQMVARGAIDAAESFGVIDENAARSLNSAVNIASAVGDMAKSGFSFAGAVGVIGGVASIVSTMMGGDSERKRLLKQNSDALAKLSRDIGGLKLNITGEEFDKAEAALLEAMGKGGGERALSDALFARGMTMGDFERIAKELGFELRDKDGKLNKSVLGFIYDALGRKKLGKVGGSFDDQLDFFQESQDIAGEEGTGRATNLLRFLQGEGGVGALAGLDFADPVKLREQLVALRARLNSAEGIDESLLGKLTGSQFNALLVQAIGMIGDAGSAGAGAGGASSAVGGTSSVVVPTGSGTGGGTAVPTDTIQAVIKAMDTNIGGILTSHTALHERIAVATEGSYEKLTSIDTKMDTLIAVSAGTDRIDAALEETRRALAVQQGAGVAF